MIYFWNTQTGLITYKRNTIQFQFYLHSTVTVVFFLKKRIIICDMTYKLLVLANTNVIGGNIVVLLAKIQSTAYVYKYFICIIYTL